MIGGADYMEINHEADRVSVTIRQNGVTAVAYLTTLEDVERARRGLYYHAAAAENFHAPTLIEYTGRYDKINPEILNPQPQGDR